MLPPLKTRDCLFFIWKLHSVKRSKNRITYRLSDAGIVRLKLLQNTRGGCIKTLSDIFFDNNFFENKGVASFRFRIFPAFTSH
jgi:hypothetical protein